MEKNDIINNIIILLFILFCLGIFYMSYKENYEFFQNVETIEEK
jgi:archaellum component FlaF (FlaF/FlaG flagellin family)